MSETQSLWLVLALIYAVECLAWLHRDALAFRSWLGRRFRIVRPARLAGNHRGGIVPVHPLPPLGTFLVAHPLPFAATADAVLGESRVFRWTELKDVRASNHRLMAEGLTLCCCGSNAHASALAAPLRKLAAAQPEDRATALREWLLATLDLTRIKARLEDLARETRSLRRYCIGLWTVLFVFAPGVVYWRGLIHTWWWLLLILFGLSFIIALSFWSVHQRHRPDAEDERFSFSLTFFLSPASAVRAVDAFSRGQLAEFHPLAVARAIGANPEFRLMAAEAVRHARFQPKPRLRGEAANLQQAAGEQWREILERWLKQQGFDPEQAVAAIAPLESTDRGYCPRCLTRFQKAAGECGDCGGVALVALPTVHPAPARTLERPQLDR